jgi:hypothetical protein
VNQNVRIAAIILLQLGHYSSSSSGRSSSSKYLSSKRVAAAAAAACAKTTRRLTTNPLLVNHYGWPQWLYSNCSKRRGVQQPCNSEVLVWNKTGALCIFFPSITLLLQNRSAYYHHHPENTTYVARIACHNSVLRFDGQELRADGNKELFDSVCSIARNQCQRIK